MTGNGPRVLAVDPGGRYCGIVLLVAGDLLEHAEVIDRRKLTAAPHELPDWLDATLARLTDLAVELRPDVIAVEGVRAPNPHVRRRDGNALTNPTGIIDTAAVYGAIVGTFGALTIAPGGNGSLIADAYPASIRSGARLGGPSEHARSAFDVARTARLRHRHPRLMNGTPRT